MKIEQMTPEIKKELTEAEKQYKDYQKQKRINNYTDTLILMKKDFEIEAFEEDEKKKIYIYTVIADTPQGKGKRPTTEFVKIYTTENIEVGKTIPVFYDFVEQKHKFHKERWNEYSVQYNKATETTTQEQLEGQQNLFNEELPF